MVLAFLAAGCQADLQIGITVEDDGSGLVRTELVLDQEAADGLLDLGDGATLPLSDLAQAGWTIVPPTRDEDGATTITAEKAFGTPSQFAEVMAELAGDGDPTSPAPLIRDFAITRQQSFGRVEYSLTGVIDPTAGLAGFADPALEAALERSVVDIITAEPYNARPEDVTIELVAGLPGELQEAGATGSLLGEPIDPRAVWSTDLAAAQPVEIALFTARRSTSALVLRGVAVVAGVLAALVAFAQLLRLSGSLRRRRPSPKVRPTDARGRPAEPPARREPAPEPANDPTTDRFRVVALDGMGVLYREGDDVNKLLVPFARQHGSIVPDEEIVLRARQLSLGRMTSADFWQAIGVAGDPNQLDADYLALHQLTPGVVRYLRALRDSGVRAACITNDAAAWAMKLRSGHSLEGLIDPWVVSGSVGVRKPDAPLYEVLRRVTGEPRSAILIVDDDLDNLDAAAALGFGTAWFSAAGGDTDARGHRIIRSFEGFSAVDTMDIVLEEGVPATGPE